MQQLIRETKAKVAADVAAVGAAATAAAAAAGAIAALAAAAAAEDEADAVSTERGLRQPNFWSSSKNSCSWNEDMERTRAIGLQL